MKISKDVFKVNYTPALENLANQTFTNLAEQLEKHTKTVKVEKAKIKKTNNFMEYIAFNLESPWDEAPYEDDFKEINGKEFEVLDKKFKLKIEERFLKKCSSITFSFVVDCDVVQKT